ncbi:hypothetical protein ACFL34_00895 [Candidatus Sumerlaeota bacterium]
MFGRARSLFTRGRGERGWTIVAVLVALAIVVVLVVMQLGGSGMPVGGTTTMKALDNAIDDIEGSMKAGYETPPNAATSGTVARSNYPPRPAAPAYPPKVKTPGPASTPAPPPAARTRTPRPQPKTRAGAMVGYADRARTIGQLASSKTLNDQLVMWKINNPGMKVTFENLSKTRFHLPPPQRNTEYVIENEAIYIRRKP